MFCLSVFISVSAQYLLKELACGHYTWFEYSSGQWLTWVGDLGLIFHDHRGSCSGSEHGGVSTIFTKPRLVISHENNSSPEGWDGETNEYECVLSNVVLSQLGFFSLGRNLWDLWSQLNTLNIKLASLLSHSDTVLPNFVVSLYVLANRNLPIKFW